MFLFNCYLDADDGNIVVIDCLYRMRLEHVTLNSTLPDLITLTLRYQNGMPVPCGDFHIKLVSRSTAESFDSIWFKITSAMDGKISSATDGKAKNFIIHVESHEMFPCFTNPFQIKNDVMATLSTGYIDNIVGWVEKIVPLLESLDNNGSMNDVCKVQDILSIIKSINGKEPSEHKASDLDIQILDNANTSDSLTY